MITRLLSQKLSYHLIGWSIYLTYEVAVTLMMGNKASFLRFAAFYAIDICLFYFNAHVVFQYAMRHRYPQLIAVPLILLELGAFTAITVVINVAVDSLEAGRLIIDISSLDFIRAAWRGVYFLGLSTAYWFVLRTISNARKANMLQIQNLEAERREAALENAHLRAQINPHLLFNALNFIYSAVVGVSDKASKAILLLADIMRYAMMEIQPDGKVELCKEVEQIKHYISLNQIRFNNRLFITTDIEKCDNNSLRIPPLLLLTFVENIFKHGNLTDAGNPAEVKLFCKDNSLCFFSRNAISASRIDTGREHIGIYNVKTRLQNYYASRFDLDIEENDATFIVNLTINL